MKQEAGYSVCVISNTGAIIKGERRAVGAGLPGDVSIAGHDDSETTSGEEGTEFECEGERNIFFECGVTDAGTTVTTAVCWIEDDHHAIELRAGERLDVSVCGSRSKIGLTGRMQR